MLAHPSRDSAAGSGHPAEILRQTAVLDRSLRGCQACCHGAGVSNCVAGCRGWAQDISWSPPAHRSPAHPPHGNAVGTAYPVDNLRQAAVVDRGLRGCRRAAVVLARAIASIAVGVTQPALLACSGAPFAAAIPPAPCGGLRARYWQHVARWWRGAAGAVVGAAALFPAVSLGFTRNAAAAILSGRLLRTAC